MYTKIDSIITLRKNFELSENILSNNFAFINISNKKRI